MQLPNQKRQSTAAPVDDLVHVFFAPEGVLHSGRLNLDFPEGPRVFDEDEKVPLFAWYEPLVDLAQRHRVRYVLCTPHFDKLLPLAPSELAPFLHPECISFAEPASFGSFQSRYCELGDAVDQYAKRRGIRRWLLLDSTLSRRSPHKEPHLLECDFKTGLSNRALVEEIDRRLSEGVTPLSGLGAADWAWR